MSFRHMNHLKLVGAAGAAALAIGAVASPAVAAAQDLTYTCDVLGPTSATLNPGSIPTSMVAGQTSKRTMKMVVHLNDLQTQAAHGLGDSVSGSIVAPGAKKSFPFKMKIPNQPIPASGATDIHASGPGKIRPLSAGTWKVKAGDMVANLTVPAGSTSTYSLNCLAPTDGTQNFGTISVSKDKTTTAVTAAYSSAKDKATGKAKVKSHFGLKATGKVKFTLKKGTHTVKSVTSSVNKKGIATASFKSVKAKGKYSITGKYAGNHNLKSSSGKDTFSVS